MKHKNLYPKNWDQISAAFKTSVAIALSSYDACGTPLWICEKCGVEHNARRINERTSVVYLVKIASAHLNHDTWNVEATLASWCQSCHMAYDCSKKQKERKRRIEELHYNAVRQVEEYLVEIQKPYCGINEVAV